MPKMLSTVTAAVALSLLASACNSTQVTDAGSTPGPTSRVHAATADAAPGDAAVDAAVVRGRSEYDFPATASVSQAARRVSSVVVGEVVGWADGRSSVESDGSGYESFLYNAVLTVKVSTSRSAGHRPGDLISVEVQRGGEVKVDGAAPEGTEPVVASIDELAAAVPVGTRVILLASPAPTAAELRQQTPGIEVRGDGTGTTPGTTLVRPHVQGLLFRDETGAFASGVADHEEEWGWLPSGTPVDKGFGHLVAEINRFHQ
ncbi:hypothetical protein [Nocardioides piscis]|uniref:Uncharacterized protein n=1 Tax=Nocardioides piscis TaxID=2714938 RepID=A0A6G7YBK9_9ACTN|nr:hypothetical protein [Nocardioides piscis]QIK74150.1 hypothetical protein G7071_00560 [Nocardioides piscis]